MTKHHGWIMWPHIPCTQFLLRGTCVSFYDLVLVVDLGIYLMGALDTFLLYIHLSVCLNVQYFLYDPLPSNELILKDMIIFFIPLNVYILYNDKLTRLDLFAIKSSSSLSFEFDLFCCGYSYIDIFLVF